MRKNFLSVFKIRIAFCIIGICSLMFLCIVRIIAICGDERVASSQANTVTLEIENTRGVIFDCNGNQLTEIKESYAVVFLPCDQALVRFVQLTSGEERKLGLTRLRNKKPAIIKREKSIKGIGIFSYKIYDRHLADLSLEHLVGYTDGTNNGVAGLEKTYNHILTPKKGTQVSFAVTAGGDFLIGSEPEITSQKTTGSLRLTVDKNIQTICSNAAKKLQKGAILVTEVKTGKIKAMVSRPGFDIDNISASVSDEDSPFLNRALSAYSVGSVFKPLIAASLLETGLGGFCHKCGGYSDILGIRFYCNNRKGHGNLSLKQALSQSCNTYFYNGAAKVSPAVLYDLAVSFGFSNKIELANGICADAGSLTTLEQLVRSKAAIANFAIGQGNIALSPLVLCNLYSAIANEGVYYTPTIIEEYVNDNKTVLAEGGAKNTVLNKQTANILKEYLISAVENGTGKAAKPKNMRAGGKTATAQTGQYSGNVEKLNAWFCGFFPADEPKYVVVVLAEGARAGGADCGPIFKEVAEKISEIY